MKEFQEIVLTKIKLTIEFFTVDNVESVGDVRFHV